MNILVTGAAGYIGSIVTEELIKEGNTVTALDNLSQGHSQAIAPKAIFVQADLGNQEALESVFRHHQIEAVMHLAADTSVEYSMIEPKKYFQNNVIYSINLLDAMLKFGVIKLIFSSTAAVYGEPERVPIKETDTTMPVSPYGETKLMFERILHWYGHANSLKFVSLRYFNAAGASEYFGEDHNPEAHLIPNVLKVALGQSDYVPIFGTDYNTKDGSCTRDYIHVLDIAKAHILALKHLEKNRGNKIYNLGNSKAYSVAEVIETAKKVTGVEIPVVNRPRRPGDPAVLVASSELARLELGWQPQFSQLKSIIESAWQWQKRHPQGYSG